MMQSIFKRGKDKRAPLFFMLHASGGTEHDLVPLVKKFNEDAPVLSVRGKGSDAGATCFFNRAEDGAIDRDHLLEKAYEIANFLKEKIKEYELTERHVVAVGLSTGATMALHLLLHHKKLLNGAILYHPIVHTDFAPKTDLTGKHVFIGATQNDPIIPVKDTKLLYEALQRADAEVTLHWENGLHYLTGEEFAASRMWYEKLESDIFTSQ